MDKDKLRLRLSCMGRKDEEAIKAMRTVFELLLASAPPFWEKVYDASRLLLENVFFVFMLEVGHHLHVGLSEL